MMKKKDIKLTSRVLVDDDILEQTLSLKTPQQIRNGMTKPAFKRNGTESLGMVSFNVARKMFPETLSH